MTDQQAQSKDTALRTLVTRYSDEFEKETDRAAVILCASMIENSLEELLRAKLVPSSTAQDPLFDGPIAPASTFSSKIEFSLRLGLISDQFARDLHIIRRIRNDFAHNVSGCSFDESATSSRVLELMRSWRHLQKGLHRDSLPPGTRHDFQFVTTWILVSIHTDLETVEPIERAQPEFGYSEDDLFYFNDSDNSNE